MRSFIPGAICVALALAIGLLAQAPAEAGWKLWKRGGAAAPSASAAAGYDMGTPPALGALPPALEEHSAAPPSAFQNLNVQTQLGAPDKADEGMPAKGGGILPGAAKMNLKSEPQSLEHLYGGDRMVDPNFLKKPGFMGRMKSHLPGGKSSALGSSKPVSLKELGANMGMPNLTRIMPQDAAQKASSPFSSGNVEGLMQSQSTLTSQQALSGKGPKPMSWDNKSSHMGFKMPKPSRFTPKAMWHKASSTVTAHPLAKAKSKWKMYRMQRHFANSNQKNLKQFGLTY